MQEHIFGKTDTLLRGDLTHFQTSKKCKSETCKKKKTDQAKRKERFCSFIKILLDFFAICF